MKILIAQDAPAEEEFSDLPPLFQRLIRVLG
jgi:hypothetical protein